MVHECARDGLGEFRLPGPFPQEHRRTYRVAKAAARPCTLTRRTGFSSGGAAITVAKHQCASRLASHRPAHRREAPSHRPRQRARRAGRTAAGLVGTRGLTLPPRRKHVWPNARDVPPPTPITIEHLVRKRMVEPCTSRAQPYLNK